MPTPQQQLTIARNNNCTPAEIAEIEREQRGLLDRVMAAKSAAKAKQDAEREAERAAAQTAAAIASAQTAGTGQDGDISSSSTPGMAGAGGNKFGSPSGAPATTGSPGGVGSAVGGSGGAGAGAGAGSRRRKQRRASVVSLRRQAGVLEKQGEKTFLNKNPAWRSRYFVLDRGTLKYVASCCTVWMVAVAAGLTQRVVAAFVHGGRYYYNEECFLRGDAPVKGNRLVMAEYGVVSNTADESMFRLVNLKVSPAVRSVLLTVLTVVMECGCVCGCVSAGNGNRPCVEPASQVCAGGAALGRCASSTRRYTGVRGRGAWSRRTVLIVVTSGVEHAHRPHNVYCTRKVP